MAGTRFTITLLISTILVQQVLATNLSNPVIRRNDSSDYTKATAASINPSHPSMPSTWSGPPSYPTNIEPNNVSAAWTNATFNILDWEPKDYTRVRVAHAVLACVAWLILFPLGGIIPRLGIRPMAQLVPLHAGVQMFAYAVFAAAAGMGIWMAKHIQQLGGYHPIIGMVILGLLAIQPLTEILNAIFYSPERHSKVIILGHVHIWLGRVLLTAGLANGGLGFLFGDSLPWNSKPLAPRIIYGVSAITVWITYMLTVVVWPYLRRDGFKLEDLRLKNRNRTTNSMKEASASGRIRQSSAATGSSRHAEQAESSVV